MRQTKDKPSRPRDLTSNRWSHMRHGEVCDPWMGLTVIRVQPHDCSRVEFDCPYYYRVSVMLDSLSLDTRRRKDATTYD
jgi:hypothetical protein